MGSITINEVRASICVKLGTAFGFDVYDEPMEQNFAEPCFFVELVNSSQKRIGYRRHKRLLSVCIHYYPADDGDMNQAVADTAEQLYFLLEYINVNENICRGTGMKHKAEGGGLHFFVDYNCHLLEIPEPDPLMEKLLHREELKHEKRIRK